MRRHAKRIAQSRLPVWAFHGGKDKAVGIEESRRMVRFIKAFGGEARLTVYPDAPHDSWTETYNNKKVFEWLLAQNRQARG